MVNISFVISKNGPLTGQQAQGSFLAMCRKNGLSNDSHMGDVQRVAYQWAVPNLFDVSISGRSVTFTDCKLHCH